jgi:16S rRNA processing protein RimM
MKPPKLTTAAKSDIPVGRIAGPFGVTGELKCDPTSAGRIVFSAGAELRCVCGEIESTVRVTAVRSHKNRLLVRLEGVTDPNAAEAYRDAVLYAPREQIALEAGEYLDADLIGCAVCGVDGRDYGSVERVEHYPASDMLIVGGKMVPMVAAFVRDIDMHARRIVLDPPPGLLDE